MYVNIVGNPDGSTAVDYTVNPSSGIAIATGPVGSMFPVNHVLPAWDIATGLNAVIGLLAAERHRRTTGEGQLIKLSLADVAFTMVANLGFLAQAQVTAREPAAARQRHVRRVRPRLPDADGRRVMVVAISLNQWQTLVARDRDRGAPAADGARPSTPTSRQEEDRYRARTRIAALHRAVVRGAHPRRGRARRSTSTACAGGPTRRSRQLLDDDWRASAENPVFGDVDQPGIGPLLTPGIAAAFHRVEPDDPPAPAPLLGTHTDEMLGDVLGLSPGEIGRLHDDGLVAARRSPRSAMSARVHARRRRASPPCSIDASLPSRPRGWPRASTPTPAVLDAGTLPPLWHWACFPPLRADRASSGATATRDGDRRWTAFPQRMWVGGRVQVERPLAARREAARAVAASCGPRSRRVAAGRFWLRDGRAHDRAARTTSCIDEEQDLVFRAGVGGRRAGTRP